MNAKHVNTKLGTEHYRQIEAAMTDIRVLLRHEGVNKPGLMKVRDRLAVLAQRTDLFNSDSLPPPPLHDQATNFAYRLYEEYEDEQEHAGGLALYANSASGRSFETPVHNHKTWAVLVGVAGVEFNRLCVRSADGGVRDVEQVELRQGSSLIFEDEDLHAISGNAPLLNFHLYGKGLEHQIGRQFYDANKHEWVYFQAHPDIIEARAGLIH